MGYFDTEKGVNEYIEMAKGYDGRALIDKLKTRLENGSTVLELGMGPGIDLDLLKQHFQVTGSDSSEVFVKRYLDKHPDADVMVLDAITLRTDRRFDAIYSNKVLQHLSKQETAESLEAQRKVLRAGGIAMHSLWYGDTCEEHSGLNFQQYTEDSFARLLKGNFNILEAEIYTEMEARDSICFILQLVK